jgi:type I restriction-modification system DNA methylase subunit
MPLSIDQLTSLWDTEKESYTKNEIGSGVQKFVKEMLKCNSLFNLSEGRLSTPDFNRTHEFLEERTRKNKRADIIIFVDPDIVIPVEVEKFGNIRAGEIQLFEYQRTWDKKYGILTDGNKWVFYNNKLPVMTFSLDTILQETDEFIEWWNEYIQPRNYYLQFFESIGQLSFFEEDISVGNRVSSFFKDITTLIRSFNTKLNIKGYFETIGNKEHSDRASTEITYAYIIQFILYKTLVDNGFAQFTSDFDSRLKRIHVDLVNETYGDILITIKAISQSISTSVYRPFIKEQEFINKELENILLKPINYLSDITPWLDIFVFIKRYNFSNVRNDIFGYIYENYLKDQFGEGNKGQFYTDPSIVNFMLEQIGYTSKNIKARYANDKDSLSLIDPSCGSGTFLYSATDSIIRAFIDNTEQSAKTIEEIATSSLFGLDIQEFPIYLAEMSILMRMLPLIIGKKYNNPIDKKIKVFKTRDSIAEFCM